MKLFRIHLGREDERYLTELERILYGELRRLSDLRIGFNIYSREENERLSISCQFWVHECYDMERIEKIIAAMSISLAEFIVDYKEQDIFEDILEHEQGITESLERKKMMQYINLSLQGEEEEGELRREIQISRIAAKAEEYFMADQQLSLEGFIRFRLKEFWDDWRSLVEYAKDEYLMDREFSGFIDSLKSLVSRQQSKLDLLHIVHLDDRNLYLYNQEWDRLYPYLENGISLELTGKQIRYEDLVMGVIISTAPNRLVIHSNQENHNIIYMMKRIFEAKVEICSGCVECKRKKAVRKMDSQTIY